MAGTTGGSSQLMTLPEITPISVQNAENFQNGIREVIERLQSAVEEWITMATLLK